MKTKSKVSQREVWLLALLPAALVVIVSFALPSPADKVAELNQRLEQARGDDAQRHKQLRVFSDERKRFQEELAVLSRTEADLTAQLRLLDVPTARGDTLNMTGILDTLLASLEKHGAKTLAIRPKDRDVADGSEWELRVAAPWSTLQAALLDDHAFPPGLALSALKMEQAQPTLSLRLWELVVTSPEPAR